MTWTEFVDEAARREAYDDWLEWARGHNDWPTEWECTVWLLRNMNDCISDEQLWTLAKQRPWAALVYCSARLSNAQLLTLAQHAPWAALRYCYERLTDEQIKQLREIV